MSGDPRDAEYTIDGVLAAVRRTAELSGPRCEKDDVEAYWIAQGVMQACDDIKERIERAERLKAVLHPPT
jgi:hypothetical protein